MAAKLSVRELRRLNAFIGDIAEDKLFRAEFRANQADTTRGELASTVCTVDVTVAVRVHTLQAQCTGVHGVDRGSVKAKVHVFAALSFGVDNFFKFRGFRL